MRALGIIYTAGNVLQNNTVCTYSKPPQHCVCASRMGCVVDAHDALLSTVESALLPGHRKGSADAMSLRSNAKGEVVPARFITGDITQQCRRCAKETEGIKHLARGTNCGACQTETHRSTYPPQAMRHRARHRRQRQRLIHPGTHRHPVSIKACCFS